ncbi:MAG: stage II sporulation protein D [bacterium]|nr:stage II sporulation protein D [bacterium]
MFYKYMIVTSSDEERLYLYLNPMQDFSNDFFVSNVYQYDLNFYRKIYHYLKNRNIPFHGNKVSIVVQDIVIATIYLNDYDAIRDELVEVLDHERIGKFVDLAHSTGIIERLKLEDYVFGVVSGEMPAVFHEEALKAQAVIARTYAVKRMSKGLKIRDYNATQIFRDRRYLKEIWGSSFNEYEQKVLKAIWETKNEVLMFEGDYIDAYYHLASNGKTEDSRNVLKLAYPYLISVDSDWDLDHGYVSRRVVPNSYLSNLLDMKVTKDTRVEILIRTIGHRVQYVKFDDKVFDGLILARRLGLDSNDFSVSIEDDYTTFTTRGHGHGLGLSKYGAEGMAKAGYHYRQILEHYYPNTYIQKNK